MEATRPPLRTLLRRRTGNHPPVIWASIGTGNGRTTAPSFWWSPRNGNERVHHHNIEEMSPLPHPCCNTKTIHLIVGSHDLRFNYSLQVDTMFQRGKPVLHMIEMATYFCAACFLKYQRDAEIWASIPCMLILRHLSIMFFIDSSDDMASAMIRKLSSAQ